MIQVNAVSRSFGMRKVLRNINLEIHAGESVMLVGPNGAGKTTLLRMIAGLLRPSKGEIRIDGILLAKAGVDIRRRLGFLSHNTLLYDDLSAEQNLRFYARMYNLVAPDKRIAYLLDRVDLSQRRHDLVRTYSRGMQQRLAVARALLHEPDILLMDEPYSGLDPIAAEALTALLTDLLRDALHANTTFLFTSHHPSVEGQLANRVLMLMRGQMVYDEAHTSTQSDALLERYRELMAQAASGSPKEGTA